MLKIDNELLICCVLNNSFTIVGSIMSLYEIKEEVAPFYEFIKI